MLSIHKIDINDRAQVRRFLDLPYRLYKDHAQWVPPPRGDIAVMLNRTAHPFYEHSDADFFIAERDGEVVGRIAALENRPYNTYHDAKVVQFYLFECENDLEIAEALFARVSEWAKVRGLTLVLGPKGFGILDVSAALQRAKGRLSPWALADLLREMRRTEWLALNGAGLAPEFQGVGGNALLYAEMDNTIRDSKFRHVDLTQVAETAVQMRQDLVNVGGEMYKNHRVYRKEI